MVGPTWCSSRARSWRRFCQTGAGPAEKEIDEDDEDFDDERVDRESDLRVRQRPEMEVSGSVSLLAAIAADDKGSDLEY